MSAKELISFPPGLLGPNPVRLDLLVRNRDLFAVSKPAGIGISADPFDVDVPLLLDALSASIASGKKQLADLEITHAGRLHGLDSEVAGVVVFANNKESEVFLRNALGSRKCEFVFELLAETQGNECEKCCDLPLVRNLGTRRMNVSHASGKKSSTIFTPITELGRYTLWEARTAENRTHQVRIHAAESGLYVPGERLYSRVRPVYLSDLKRGYRRGKTPEKPLYDSVCMHLRSVTVPQPDGTLLKIEAPRPRSFQATVSRIERHAG